MRRTDNSGLKLRQLTCGKAQFSERGRVIRQSNRLVQKRSSKLADDLEMPFPLDGLHGFGSTLANILVRR